MDNISKKLSIILTTLNQLEEHFETRLASHLRTLVNNALKTLMTVTDCWLQQCNDSIQRNETDLGVMDAYIGSIFNHQEIPVLQIFQCFVDDLHKILNDILTNSSMEKDVIIENILNAFSIVMYACELRNHQNKNSTLQQQFLRSKESFSFTKTELLQQTHELQQSICIQD